MILFQIDFQSIMKKNHLKIDKLFFELALFLLLKTIKNQRVNT